MAGSADVCNSTDLPEVEIISLLQEQLPHYKLRADTIYGYDHDDWLHTPLLSPDTNLDLTVEQIEETLKYFLLCAERVGQMTKTYNDIDAVTRLLEEKERDLELAARIGQSLLKKNKTLSERNGFLEEQVEHIREEVSQLRHDLSMKDELLQFYTSAAEESEGDSSTSTPIRHNDSTLLVPSYFPLDSLQKKLKDLEAENISLRSEASHLETETEEYEEKEQQLVNDVVKELRDANHQMSTLAEELARKTDDASRQQEEITHLLSQIVDLQKKSKSYAVENEELTQHLGAAKDAQRQLTAELRELEDKYAECMEMLHEAQEELKNLRNKSLPLSTPRRFHSLGLFPMDSLAAEIEGTMRKELAMDDPEVEEQKLHPKRVFETVKNVNLMRQRSSLAPSPMNIPGSNRSSCLNSGRSSCLSTPRSSLYGGDMGSILIDNRTNSFILETPDHSVDDSNKKPGTPGTPGSQDLEAALRRLSLRRDNCLSERRFFEEERDRKLQGLVEKGEVYSGSMTPTESIMSLGGTHPSSVWSGYSFSSRSYLPEKLQIVKPLEGSATLHQWQQLAQPNLGGILDTRPGVVTKGFRPLELDLEHIYQFTDFEEEDFEVVEESDDLSVHSLSTSGCSGIAILSRQGLRTRSSSCSSTCSGRAINNSLPEGGVGGDGEAREEGETLGPGSTPLLSPAPPDSENQENQDQAAAADGLSAHYPGKCMSNTSSTYTFTTCRIMHPSDELTRVTPSLMSGPSASCVVTSSSSVRSTPCSTPCTPRRLSLAAESFTNLRDSTKTMSTSGGLVRLLQERGISAAVYNPQSWDRADCSTSIPTGGAPLLLPPRPPDTLPSTPPNSPTHHSLRSKPSGPFDLSPSALPYDNFLASKPASSILKEVRAEAQSSESADSECQIDVSVHNLKLVDKLKRFSVAGASPSLSGATGPTMLGPLSGLHCPSHFGPSVVASPIGGLGPALNAGIRRNRSYPAMVGAGMAMKGPGPHSPTDMLLASSSKLPRQTSLNDE
ncbi:trafficking kinesin-binding protein 1-like isoform X1 [Coregonus clupeaformis]|uniref:trafficking kinesin-binding protein 1-like isoform X1 n=2 Tax=Coregonus clupeaformis TaxID=59861 RepID=UPI001E1C31E0|nr:trafficking kinesin-binding protein 1-like isoform X1 [Coregonus clupeaformis]